MTVADFEFTEEEFVRDNVSLKEDGTMVIKLRDGYETTVSSLPPGLTVDEYLKLMQSILWYQKKSEVKQA